MAVLLLVASAGKGAEPALEYEPAIEGVGGLLASRLREVSTLFEKQSDPPATIQGLRRRAQADRDLFYRVLRARGFYEGKVVWSIDSAAEPVRVVLRVQRGPRYKLVRFDIAGLPDAARDLAEPAGLQTVGVVLGNPAVAQTVLDAETRLLEALATRSFPFAEAVSRDVVIDRGAKTMEVQLAVDAGPFVRFGELRIEGAARTDEQFVLRRLTFSRGQAYDPAAVEASRKALFDSGVFSAVNISVGTRADVSADGEAPVRVLIAEAKRRTVGAGVKYSSADGVGGRAFWEHRNLFGGAERLRTEIEATQLQSTGGVTYSEPDWLRRDQVLLLAAGVDADDTVAYERYALQISAGVERPLAGVKGLVGTAGISFEESVVDGKADPGDDTFTLFGLPLGLRYDASDDVLDPSRGFRSYLSFTPYVSAAGTSVEMFVLRGTQSVYVPLLRDRRLVWASRLSLGSILGPERGKIPADKRFYAGGGDSVRGYEYQKVGPLDADNDPFGGRSLVQGGSELRWKVTDTFGLVPFVEGANVYGPAYPDFEDGLQWGAGLGFRYFTVAGPIRLDVAFPLNPRSSDDVFEIYISLGQAF